jgi:arabinan endo-1,5-alpha-L-arabinosidase
LLANGNVTGPTVDNPANDAAVIGTWKLKGDHNVDISIYGNTYKGVFCKAYDEFGLKYVMTFSAMSNEGVTIWGSGLAAIEKDW